MMMQIPGGPPGAMVEATEMEVADVVERWNTIVLTNGDTLRMKSVITQVFAVPGMKDQFGHQQYLVNAQNILIVRNANEEPKGALEAHPGDAAEPGAGPGGSPA
jgi:hypothetical protein